MTGGTLRIGDQTTANNDGVNDRLGTGASLTLGGANGAGRVTLYGAASGDTTHSLTSLTVGAGYNTIDKLGGGNVMLVFTGDGSSVYTQAGGILDVVDDNVASFTNAPTGSSVSGTGADAILLGALFKSDDFVGTVAGTVAAANYTTQNDASLFAAGTNVVNDGDFTNATSTGASINSLRFGVTSTTELVIGSADTDTLDIASGQILVSKNVDADVAIAGPGKLTSALDLLVFNNSSHTLDLIAPITGSIGLTKAGAGTVSLGAMTSDFTGVIRISTGTLDFNSADTATYANEIAGEGSLTKTGPSTLNLTGNVNVDGTLDVNGGSLVMTGTSNSTGGNLSVAAGATADLANTVIGNQANVDGDLTMTGGSVVSNANIHSGAVLTADGTGFATVNVNSGAEAHLTGISYGTINASGTVLIDGVTTVNKVVINDGGEVTIDGTPTIVSGQGLYVNNGTLNLVTDALEGGGGIDVLKAGANSNNVATVNIGGNIINTSGSTHYDIAQGTDSVVYYNHTAGTVNCNYNNFGGGGDLHGYQSGGVFHPARRHGLWRQRRWRAQLHRHRLGPDHDQLQRGHHQSWKRLRRDAVVHQQHAGRGS